jgi:hypothetical protein
MIEQIVRVDLQENIQAANAPVVANFIKTFDNISTRMM